MRPLYPLIQRWRTIGQEAAMELFTLAPAPGNSQFAQEPNDNWGWDTGPISASPRSPQLEAAVEAECRGGDEAGTEAHATGPKEEVGWTVGRMMDMIGCAYISPVS